MLKGRFKCTSLFFFVLFLFSCQKHEKEIKINNKGNDNELTKEVFINPTSIDSLINDSIFLKKKYGLNTMESFFDFNSPIASATIKKYYIDSLFNENEPEDFWEIKFSTFNKVNSINNKDYRTSSTCKRVYDTNGNLIGNYLLWEDLIDNVKGQHITIYDYFNNGNLKSKLFVKWDHDTYVLDEYVEFEYILKKEAVLVTSNHISSKMNAMEFYREETLFDTKKRIISIKKSILNEKGMLKYLFSETFYDYKNVVFFKKPTSITTIYKPSNEKYEVLFKYDNSGYIIEKKVGSVLSDDVRKFRYFKNYLELEASYKFTPKIKNYKALGVEVDNSKEVVENERISYDNFKSIIKFNTSTSQYFFTLRYKYDANKNWIEKKNIRNHGVSYKNVDYEEDELTTLYKREINYKDFEEIHSQKIIDLDQIFQLKERILNTYQISENK